MPVPSLARTTQNASQAHHTTTHPGHTQLSGTPAPGHPTPTRQTMPSPPTRPPPPPQREHLWKGAWTQDLITSLAYNARAYARTRPWQTNAAKTQLAATIKAIGTLTTTYTLSAWKHRRRAAIQIHQTQTHPALFDHAPRLPHMDKIKYSDPILTEDQLHSTLQRILRLNPARPHATRRTFGRRRLHQQPPVQPPAAPGIPPTHAEPATHQFTIGVTHFPNQRLTQSLIQALPYCVCCL